MRTPAASDFLLPQAFAHDSAFVRSLPPPNDRHSQKKICKNPKPLSIKHLGGDVCKNKKKILPVTLSAGKKIFFESVISM